MKLLKLLTAGLIAVLLFSCDDNGGHEDLPKLEVDEELKDYFVHEEGTKFVMEDTAENLVDTLVITSSRKVGCCYVDGPDGPKPVSDYLSPYYRVNYEPKNGDSETFEDRIGTKLSPSKRDGKTYNRIRFDTGIRGSFFLKREGEWIAPEDEVIRKESIKILGETYYDVLIFETSLNRNIVFGKNIGPLRIKHKEDFLLKEKIEP